MLKWRDGGKAPSDISRGTAVMNGNVAYFIHPSGGVVSYHISSKTWSQLSNCPFRGCSLAVINGQLTVIGGCTCRVAKNRDTYSNKLLSVPGYKEIFPPMPTKRMYTTAMTSNEHLIVAGGTTGHLFVNSSTSTEVMDTKTLVWSTVASLPHPYNRPSGTICGDQLCMLGGWDNKGDTKSVLTCSLTELLQSSSSSSSIWHRVADTPAYSSNCAAVNGELLAVGGCDEHTNPTAAIHKYNPTSNSWDLISNMPTARYFSFAVVLPTNEIMIVGGKNLKAVLGIDKVEIAEFSLS